MNKIRVDTINSPSDRRQAAGEFGESARPTGLTEESDRVPAATHTPTVRRASRSL
jgi:hypothetical protein